MLPFLLELQEKRFTYIWLTKQIQMFKKAITVFILVIYTVFS